MKFSEFGLKKELLSAVNDLGYEEATPIQEKCIPLLIQKKDAIGQSLTGSGKTAAFALPILNNLTLGKASQVLVLVPTRELAQQVKDNFDAMSKNLNVRSVAVFGGVGYEWQIKEMRFSEVIVATPGRLLDHLGQRTVNLSNVRVVVLDEADRMFDMGFERDVDRILSLTPRERQTVLFSATMPQAAKNIAQKYLKNPVHIKEQLHVDRGLLKQIAYFVPLERKFSLLMHLLKTKNGTAIVFCRTKREADKIGRNINKNGLIAGIVHGDISQNQRQRAVDAFKYGELDALVATDVAARGLDIKNVSHVYNYNIPKTAEDYTHRIGRTARAGASGEAITFVSEDNQREYRDLTRSIKLIEEPVPEFEQIVMIKREHYSGKKPFDREERGGDNFGRERHSFNAHKHYGGTKPHFGSKSFGGEKRNYSSHRGHSPKGNYSSKRSFAPKRGFTLNQDDLPPIDHSLRERTPRGENYSHSSSHYGGIEQSHRGNYSNRQGYALEGRNFRQHNSTGFGYGGEERNHYNSHGQSPHRGGSFGKKFSKRKPKRFGPKRW